MAHTRLSAFIVLSKSSDILLCFYARSPGAYIELRAADARKYPACFQVNSPRVRLAAFGSATSRPLSPVFIITEINLVAPRR